MSARHTSASGHLRYEPQVRNALGADWLDDGSEAVLQSDDLLKPLHIDLPIEVQMRELAPDGAVGSGLGNAELPYAEIHPLIDITSCIVSGATTRAKSCPNQFGLLLHKGWLRYMHDPLILGQRGLIQNGAPNVHKTLNFCH